MKTSLIITTYNWPEALELIFLSLKEQTVMPNEIVIADDGSGKDTLKVAKKYKKIFPSLIHIWQEDKGFRAAEIRNKAIAAAKGEYIILIDGDMILDKRFIEDHLKFAQKKTFLQGGRVLLTKDKTEKILKIKQNRFSFFENGLQNRHNNLHIPFLTKLFLKEKASLKGIKTCNFSFFREDCLKVNGFNEDFQGWGREDSEFAARLINSNILRRDIKFGAIAYHLWHNENPRDNLQKNDKILNETILKKIAWCKNGIDKYLQGKK